MSTASAPISGPYLVFGQADPRHFGVGVRHAGNHSGREGGGPHANEFPVRNREMTLAGCIHPQYLKQQLFNVFGQILLVAWASGAIS